jgi:acyl-CoA synthetase (AMP-forming)/AMP-acid ligase II
MRDLGGWSRRLTQMDIDQHMASGAWGERTLVDDTLERVQQAPDQIVAWDGEAITVSRVLDTALAVAGGLRRMGVNAGDVVAFQLPNRWECLAINLAACLIGAVVTPIVPIYREKELGYMLGHSRARALFIPDQFRGTDYRQLALALRPRLPELVGTVVLGEPGPDNAVIGFAEFAGGAPLTLPEIETGDANRVKLLMYTSGTTGRPKGVLHTHNTLRAEQLAVRDYWQISARDVALMPSPVTHITGYLYGLEMPLVLGSRAVLMDRWEPARAFDLVEQHGVTLCIAATPFLSELVAEAEGRQTTLASLRLFACGGAPVPPELIRRAARWLPRARTMRVYGSTEAPTIALGITASDAPRYGVETEGRIVGHEVRIVDPLTAAPVPDSQQGEIVTRGPELFVGYADSADNETAFLPDGGFLTGDLGRIVDGEYLALTGRKKELIIRGGVNIAPKEIEDLLSQHPHIQDVAVVGIPHRRLGETVAACVVTQPGRTIDLASISGFLARQGLAKQKWPQHLEVMAELQRTAAGKIKKVELAEELAHQLEPL